VRNIKKGKKEAFSGIHEIMPDTPNEEDVFTMSVRTGKNKYWKEK